MILAMTDAQMQGAVLVVFALLYMGICSLILFVSGDGFLGIVRGRVSVLVALLQYAMAVVGFVGVGGVIALELESVTLTMIAAYTYLVFVLIRFKDPLAAKYNAIKGQSISASASGNLPPS